MNKIVYVHIILSFLATLSLQFDLNEVMSDTICFHFNDKIFFQKDYENYDLKQHQLYSNLLAAQQQNLVQKKLDITQYSDSNAPQKSAPIKIKQGDILQFLITTK